MPIAFVNAAAGQNATSTTTLVLAAAAFNAVAGNLIVVGIRQGFDHTLPSSITDTALNSYVHIPGADSSIGGGDLLTIWYAKNISGNASNIVTVHWTGSGQNFTGVCVRQYSGARNLDTWASGSGGGASLATSSAFTTTVASEVIVAFTSVTSITETFVAGTIGGVAATNLSGDNSPGSQMMAGEDRIVSSLQSAITATMTWNGTFSWEISVATFAAIPPTPTAGATNIFRSGHGSRLIPPYGPGGHQ